MNRGVLFAARLVGARLGEGRRLMRLKPRLLCIWLVIAGCVSFAQGGAVVERFNPKSYVVRVGAEVALESGIVSELVINLPRPEDSQYQDIVPRNPANADEHKYPETGDTYQLFQLVSKGKPGGGKTYTAASEYTVTLYEIQTNFDAIDPLPYNTGSDLYRRYTAKQGDYVVPNHPRIVRIADSLGGGTDAVGYARRAYEYVAKNFTYKNPYTGLHTLDEIFASGGGDCGSFSSVFVSVLRRKGIPARHLVGRKANGELHIMAEFYVEGNGWIPVDATYRNDKPGVDYFGRIRDVDRMLVLSRDVWLTVLGTSKPEKVGLLQTFHFWWWGKKCKFNSRDLFSITAF